MRLSSESLLLVVEAFESQNVRLSSYIKNIFNEKITFLAPITFPQQTQQNTSAKKSKKRLNSVKNTLYKKTVSIICNQTLDRYLY